MTTRTILPVVRRLSIARWASAARANGSTLVMSIFTALSEISANERCAIAASRSGRRAASVLMLNPATE